ncbi:MAG: OmpW family outer membrane protein [Xanthomonadales bacterium]|nr:OmpW family outer membrane protein [Xanthomonadales bacterium]
MKSKLTLLIAAALLSGQAFAHEPGTWMGRVGITNVDPKSDNSDIVDADAGAALNLNAVYFFNENWAVDILAAIPFNHDIELKDGTKVGETDQLPPTVSIQYHFPNSGNFYPYVGLGVNYTTFFSEETTGPLAGTELVLDDSFGLAAQIGADWRLNENWFLNFDARWMDIDTDAEVRGADLAFEVEIDPLVYGFSLGYQF